MVKHESNVMAISTTPEHRPRFGALLLALVTATAACARGEREAPRLYENPTLGVRVQLTPGWKELGDELKSRGGSLLSFRAHSLVGAERTFLERFPDSLIPQLEQWARSSFGYVGEARRTTAVVAGIDALELTYPVSARVGDREGKLIYWVVRPGDLFYILRATVSSKAPASDENDLRAMIAAVEFHEPR